MRVVNLFRIRLFAYLISLLAAPGIGSASSIEFDRISLADGLSQSSVQAMVQGPGGYLWIGTQYGLDRFDGYGFRNWRPGTESSNGLSHGFVRALMFDRDDTLWIGTSNGLNRLDPRTGRIRQYFPEGFDRNGETLVVRESSLAEDDLGNVLAATSHGPVRWIRAADRLEPVAVDWNGADKTRSRLLRDVAGAIWLATGNGLWRLDADRDRFAPVVNLTERIETVFGGAAENIAVALPEGGVAWATEIGLFLVSPGAGSGIRHLKPTGFGLAEDRVDAVALDSHGHLWLRTRDWIVRATGADWRTWQVMLDAPRRVVLTKNDRDKLSLAETRDGRIWLGGMFGVAVLAPGADRLRLLSNDPDNPRSLPPTLTEVGYTLLAGRFGALWVGTNLGGLARLPPQSSRFTHVRDARPGNRGRNIVRAIAEQRHAGNEWVWVSNHNAGITVWSRDNQNRYRRVAEYAQTLGNLPGDTLRAITPAPDGGAVWMAGRGWIGRATRPGAPVEVVATGLTGLVRPLRFDADGRLWTASGSSLRRFEIDPAGTATLEYELNLSPEGSGPRLELFSFCLRKDNQIVAGGFGGLVLVEPATGNARRFLPAGRPGEIPENQVFHVHCADDRTVWFGTRGAGLGRARFDSEGEPQFDFIGTEDGLADDTIYAILPGLDNDFWLSSNRGLMRFSPENGKVDRYGPSDGVQEYEFNNTVAHIGASGRYYFGGINGWNVFDPESIQPLPDPPIVHAESIRANDRELPAAPAGQERIELAHDQNRLEIEYTGLHFAAPEQVRYAYRLSGLDNDWIDAGGERLARYASLPPGDYAFEVKAANPDGVWSTPELLLSATIKPPLWATPWAWARTRWRWCWSCG